MHEKRSTHIDAAAAALTAVLSRLQQHEDLQDKTHTWINNIIISGRRLLEEDVSASFLIISADLGSVLCRMNSA